MALFDCASVKRIDRSYARRMVRHDGLIAHIAVSNAPFPSYLAGTKAHFYIRKDGTICQEIDTAFQSGAQLEGNPFYLSVETEGGVGSDVNQPWTPAQVNSLGRLYAEAMRVHGMPARLMESSRIGERGLGWHRLGIDGNFPATGILRGRAQRGGGLRFSKSRGKICPTDRRIEQMPAALAIAAGTQAPAVGGGTPPAVVPQQPAKPTPAAPAAPAPRTFPAIELVVDGDFGGLSVRALQAVIPGGLRVDGDFGPVTKRAVQTWLKGLGYYGGLIDGDFGSMSVKALQSFLRAKGKDVGPADGSWGPRTTRALQAYLNDQRRYL